MRYLPIGERTDPPEYKEKVFRCPMCNAELEAFDSVFVANDGEVLGCESCVSKQDAIDVEDALGC